MKLIHIQNHTTLPKYKQIVLSIEMAIADDRLKRNDKLPSVNKISLEFGISRDTALLAFEELKKRGIVYAIPGKGYYVKSVEFSFEQRLFVLFDELNAFKEALYNSFLNAVDNRAQIDIYFHHFNLEMFKKLINESNGNYSKYIIMPSNLQGTTPFIKSLPKQDVYILDQTNPELNEYPSIHQNFALDIYNALLKGTSLLKKHQQLILIYPGQKEPYGMVEGFRRYCNEYNFNHHIINDFTQQTIELGSVFIIPNDEHLVNVIEQAKRQQLRLGTDFGIISYNDTSLKKVVENGITTISTDFKAMGATLADMVLTAKKEQLENPSQLIVRNSL